MLEVAVENRDYYIDKKSSGCQGGRPKEDIWLTRDCVKRVASKSRTRNAQQVLTYLISMEDAYAEFIKNGIQDRMNKEDEDIKEQKQQGLIKPPKKGEFKVGHCVYVTECAVQMNNGEVVNRYKIGRTKDLNRRAAEHWHTLPGFVRVIYQKMCPNHEFLETCIHTGLEKLKVDNEIFITDPKKVIDTIELCMKMRDQLCSVTGDCTNSDEESESQHFYGRVKSPRGFKIDKCNKTIVQKNKNVRDVKDSVKRDRYNPYYE